MSHEAPKISERPIFGSRAPIEDISSIFTETTELAGSRASIEDISSKCTVPNISGSRAPIEVVSPIFTEITKRSRATIEDTSIEGNQYDDLTQISSKLLQAYELHQIFPELQAPSNNAAEDDWLVSIENYVDGTTDKPQIQRIPSFLRDKHSNKSCFDPLIVSIGPCHYRKGNPHLEAFEKLKIPIAQKFGRACDNQVSIKQLYEEVAKVGSSARKCYEKDWTKEYDDEVFNKMMFLDACFVLYFIIYVSLKTKDTNMQQNEADPLHRWRPYLVFVQRDLFLLENQIPLLVLNVLMKFMFKSESQETELIQNFLDKKVIMPPQENSCNNDVKKFLAQMIRCGVQKKEKRKLDMDASDPLLLHRDPEHLIGASPEDKNQKKEKWNPPHLLHLVREQLIGLSSEDENKKSVKCPSNLVPEQPIGSSPEDKNKKKSAKWHSYRSVTELKSAGIHFRPSQTNHVTDVKFKSHLISGTLTLPPILVDDSTKELLLNLVAYEMCSDGPSDYRIASYVCLMDSLIDHADDVKELRRRRILVNNLGSDEELAKLFNEIANDLVCHPSAYADVKLKIQNHCKSKAKVWMAEWMHDHFSSPWAFLAFLGAIFVIALTVVQTYFAVFPH